LKRTSNVNYKLFEMTCIHLHTTLHYSLHAMLVYILESYFQSTRQKSTIDVLGPTMFVLKSEGSRIIWLF